MHIMKQKENKLGNPETKNPEKNIPAHHHHQSQVYWKLQESGVEKELKNLALPNLALPQEKVISNKNKISNPGMRSIFFAGLIALVLAGMFAGIWYFSASGEKPSGTLGTFNNFGIFPSSLLPGNALTAAAVLEGEGKEKGGGVNLEEKEDTEMGQGEENSRDASEGKIFATDSAFTDYLPANSAPILMLKNKKGKEIGKYSSTLNEDGRYSVELSERPEEGRIPPFSSSGKISLAGVQASAKIDSRIDEFIPDPSKLSNIQITTKTAAAEVVSSADVPLNAPLTAPSAVPFANATITLPKKGQAEVEVILRCENFHLDNFTCSNWEPTAIPFQDHGDFITFTVDQFSGYSGGDIIATGAVHLYGNYSFISDIYEDVNATDGVLSEPIYAGEIVRVTFEKNLTDGRIIDVYATSNATVAFFDILEAGTNHSVGRSPQMEVMQLHLMEVHDLSKPTQIFDFKVARAGIPSEQCQQECEQTCIELNSSERPQEDCLNECPSLCSEPLYDMNRTAYLQFELIHDQVINDTHADGLIVWGPINNASSFYSKYNNSDNFDVIRRGEGVGTNGSNDIEIVRVVSNHERDENIMGFLDLGSDLNIFVYDRIADTWGNGVELTQTTPTFSTRSFDFGVEDISGEVLIAYENSSVNDLFFNYTVWNGSAYSMHEAKKTGFPVTSQVNFISMYPQPGTDNIMVLLENDTGAIAAVFWNGSGFDNDNNFTITYVGSANTGAQEGYDFGWVGGREQGFVAYGSLDQLNYRTFNLTGAVGSKWSEETTLQDTSTATGNIDTVEVCEDPYSSYVGIMVQDSETDLNVSMWTGETHSSHGLGMISQETSPTHAGANNKNMACTWFNSTTAMFGFIDAGALLMDYFYFTKESNWSTTTLVVTFTTQNFASDDIAGLQFAGMNFLGPVSSFGINGEGAGPDDIMVVAEDINRSLRTLRWTGSAFVSNTILIAPEKLEEINGGQRGGEFAYTAYDMVPNVTNSTPSGVSYDSGTVVYVNATAVDNINLSYIYASILAPNGSEFNFSLQDFSLPGEAYNNVYNSTFTHTATTGTYTLTIVANDTSTHKNYNRTTSSVFTINAAAAAGSKNLISQDSINLSQGSSAQGGGFVVSSTDGRITNGTSLTYAAFDLPTLDPPSLSWLNLSAIININLSLIANGSHGNYVNVTFAWVLAKANGSTMLNTTVQNSTLNQTAFNYSFNTNLLPDGIYNISVYVENISEGATRIVNYSRGFEIAIDRTPPNITNFFMNTSNNTVYTFPAQTAIVFNATVNDSTTSVVEVKFGLINTRTNTEFNITAVKKNQFFYYSQPLAHPSLATGPYTVRLYAKDSLDNVNQSIANLSFTLNSLPTAPLTGIPINDSAITNRTPIFLWANATDADGDVISYHIQVDDNARFNNPEINVSAIQDLSLAFEALREENTTWYSSVILNVDTRYYWRVRANDSQGFGNWSNGWNDGGPGDAMNNSNFTVDSLLAFSFLNSAVEFGSMDPGSMNDTTDQIPLPFRAENTGNIFFNVTLNGSALFSSVALNTSYYQFKVRENESGSFDVLSTTTWRNMSKDYQRPFHVVELNWRDVSDDFLMDLNVTVPSAEPGGLKLSNVTFTIDGSGVG